jgi:hypothetical protein
VDNVADQLPGFAVGDISLIYLAFDPHAPAPESCCECSLFACGEGANDTNGGNGGTATPADTGTTALMNPGRRRVPSNSGSGHSGGERA